MVSEDMAYLTGENWDVLGTVIHSKGKKEDTLRNSLEWPQVHTLKRLSAGPKVQPGWQKHFASRCLAVGETLRV